MRKRRKAKSVRLEDDRVTVLLNGCHWDPLINRSLFLDDEEKRKCWNTHRDYLMSFCEIPMHQRDIGTIPYWQLRPWAFWKFDHGLPEIKTHEFFNSIFEEYEFLKRNNLLVPSDEKMMEAYNQEMEFRQKHLKERE